MNEPTPNCIEWILTIEQLASMLHGRLELGSLPPLEGRLTAVGRICTNIHQVADGDVYWAVDGMMQSGCEYVDEAFARGASGIVATGYRGIPWPGRWALHVADSGAALMATALDNQVLQLRFAAAQESSPQGAANTLPMALCRTVSLGQLTLLDWSRNATPDLWPNVLEELRGLDSPGRRWIACGDLCSPQWDQGAMHQRIGIDAVRLGHPDGLIACGHLARHVVRGARKAGLAASHAMACGQLQPAVAALQRWVSAGDIVLIAGSRHLNIFPMIEYLERNHSAQAA